MGDTTSVSPSNFWEDEEVWNVRESVGAINPSLGLLETGTHQSPGDYDNIWTQISNIFNFKLKHFNISTVILMALYYLCQRQFSLYWSRERGRPTTVSGTEVCTLHSELITISLFAARACLTASLPPLKPLKPFWTFKQHRVYGFVSRLLIWNVGKRSTDFRQSNELETRRESEREGGRDLLYCLLLKHRLQLTKYRDSVLRYVKGCSSNDRISNENKLFRK